MSNYSSLFRVLSPSRVQTKFEENSPTSTDIMLGCIVLGEDNAFPVDFDTNKTIGHLKGAIKEQAGLAEPAHKLILWHVNIPENEKHEIYEGINIEEKFGGVKLVSDLKIIGQEFKKQPPSEHIHIIVELPATTGKRRHRDSDLDEESRTPKKERQTPKTLDSLLTSSILQPHITNTPSHKFYDRDQALHSMLEVARSNYQGRKNPDHKAHMFILIPGGIGIGKTRMGWESKYLSSIPTTRSGDADAFIEALKDPCYIFIDLNNGSKYIEDLDDKETPSIRIGTRVAVASGLIPKCSRLRDLIKTNTTELFQFSDVICEILKRRSKKVEAIIIHLDEYQLYINDVQNYQQQTWTYSRDFFKLMLREIGNVMRGNNIESEFKGKYFIIPICTGTSAIDIHFLPTEHTQKLLELEPLNYKSAKSMFLDKYEYSRQTTDEGRDLVVQGLKSRDSSDFNNENIEKLSTDFCNFVLNQQHFQIAISDTGFIPKFIDDLLGPSTLMSDFDWGNQLFIKISNRNIVKIGKDPGNWKSLNDIRTVISFGLTRQLINRDFRLTSGMSIGELERSGLIYLSNIKDEWFIIVMPFMLLKVLNNKLLTSNVEDIKPVFQDNLLFIPTHENPWQWQNFELLYGHFQKALIDSLIYVQESKIKHIEYGIRQLQKDLKEKGDVAIEDDIESQNKELDRQKRHNWQLSDIFRGALGADTLLQRKVRLHNLKVFTENKKFLVKTDDVASFDESVLCDDKITRSLEEGIFRRYQGNANIDHRWILDSADNGKKLAIFSQIKYSERGVTTKMSTPAIKEWYDTTMASVKNYETEYDVVLVLFTNRTITGNINIETMPHLLLIYPDNIEMYLSPAFAHRGLVDGPSENDDG